LLTISNTRRSMAPPGRSRRSPLPTRLRPVLQQPRSDRTRSNLRTCIVSHDSVYAIRPLNFRRPTSPSPSPYWKRTWTIYSKSENPKPPHVGGLRVALVTASPPATTSTLREGSMARRRSLRLCEDDRRCADDYFDYSSRLETSRGRASQQRLHQLLVSTRN
jgi:hypothetical protein